MKNLIYAVVFMCGSALFFACGSDDDNNGAECTPEWFSEQSTRISEAVQAYATDQSEENCLAYVKTLEDWLDAVDDCDGITQAEIEETRTELEDLKQECG